ncbi:M48 family metallopeptidase [Enterovirga rhinocerotis]|uniref:Heat shock protein n=1 Tax=Enterovirga rhinocerotis TaxID=1339210 RepID=A0A4R7BX15_9HYPH|nr:M48 family metallopeptidase [Enterovirga rhinocerotis]TDR90488.1 heat shock protein [Enterovirga rhinocerotis]
MLPAFGLYTHIRANRIRSRFLLAGLVVLSLVLVFAVALLMRALSGEVPNGYRHDLGGYLAGAFRDLPWLAPFALAGSAVWIAIAFRFNQTLIDLVTGARPVTRADQPRLYNLLENLCISRGVPVPILRVMDNSAPNAFASGLKPEQHSITVTTGLLETLDDAELECVLAHELTHIRNDDVRTMVIAVIVTGILSFVGELLLRSNMSFRSGSQSGSSRKDKGGAGAAILIALVLIALVWFLSQAVKFALSRSREYLADAGAVELTKNPDAMISALQKIEGKGEIEKVPSGIMELCLDNPRSGIQDLFATHPSIADRIDALRRYAGGTPAIDAAPEPVSQGPASVSSASAPALGNPWNR